MNCQKLIVVVVAVAMLLVCTNQSVAQRNMRQMVRLFSVGAGQLHCELLAMEGVQKELELSDEQLEDMAETVAEINDEWRSDRREIMMAGDEGAEAEMKELLKDLQREEKPIVAKLNDKQRNRLQQLMYQRMGTTLFRHPPALKALGVTDEQGKDLKAAFKQNQEDMDAAVDEAGEDFRAVFGARQELEKALLESVMAVLDDEQKEKLTEMKGEEFEFPQRRGGRRSGRRDF